MNRLLKWCVVLLPLVTIVCSCTKNVETEPREAYTLGLIFDTADRNANNAKQYLASLYTFLPGGFNRVGGDFLDAASGDAVPTRTNTSVENYTNGLVSSINNPDAYWSNSYAGIRNANIFLANIDKVPTAAASIVTMKAEARFIRASLYFELLKRYGGIPLIGDQVFTIDNNLQLPRNTFSEVLNYIVSECDAIKGNLYPDALAATDVGRVPKGAAIALKCRLYLYGASPLFNGGAMVGSLKDKGLLGYTTYDASRWQKVIDAAEELKTLNYYTLQASFATMFVTKQNTEVILAKQIVNNFDLENANAPVGYVVQNTRSGGRTSPTQNLVDAFTMTNGLPITDPASGYSAAAPYINRDPRLGATVFYNGLRWLNRAVETFEGGLDKPNDITLTLQTKTGYYLRKFMADFSNSTSYASSSHNFIYFRYAEILLNYAEALNEVDRVEDAVAQIILIRKRAGITAGSNNRYGIPAGITQIAMRTLIQAERRVELAFEEHHFWDIRRWSTATTPLPDLSATLRGIQIVKTSTGTFTYTPTQLGTMVYSNKLLLMPIPYDEITKDSKLEQNPGW